MTSSDSMNASPLGKSTVYPTEYDPSLLYPIERKPMREKLGITGMPTNFPGSICEENRKSRS